MNATTTSASEMASLKARLKATWMSGDFDKIARIIGTGGAEFIARLQLTPGARLLDVACGTGCCGVMNRRRVNACAEGLQICDSPGANYSWNSR